MPENITYVLISFHGMGSVADSLNAGLKELGSDIRCEFVGVERQHYVFILGKDITPQNAREHYIEHINESRFNYTENESRGI